MIPINNPCAVISLGEIRTSTETDIDQAMATAFKAWPDWEATEPENRAKYLDRTAELIINYTPYLVSLCVREGGKCLPDAHNEIREAVDFLRFYASQCRQLFKHPITLPGPVGEQNRMYLRGKGIFLCISPWNFPIAIFTGQIAAALVAGNTVIAKPAMAASACAQAITKLFKLAGLPHGVLHLLIGKGSDIGNKILTDKRLAGIAFTGSNNTAKSIERTMAEANPAVGTLIAETGGINAMLVDSTALPEQVVKDIVFSAFNSAGQRCSALRVLYLQEEIADRVLHLIRGRMDQLNIGNPALLETDMGPVIDAATREELQSYIDRAKADHRLLYQSAMPASIKHGCFVPPAVISLDSIGELEKEIFGPVLHVVRYEKEALDSICDDINATGYGLTFGIHSRLNHRINKFSKNIRAGNVYINRNMVGAIVGSQPFGGSGLSGTGPKAGGPHYLLRFATEQSISDNTAVIGGDPGVLSLTGDK